MGLRVKGFRGLGFRVWGVHETRLMRKSPLRRLLVTLLGFCATSFGWGSGGFFQLRLKLSGLLGAQGAASQKP